MRRSDRPNRSAAPRAPSPALPAEAALAHAVARAWEARRRCVEPGTTIHRLLHDEADGVPHVQVDRAGTVLVCQAYDARWAPRLEELSRALLAGGGSSVRAMVRDHGGRALGDEHAGGSPLPTELSAEEDGLAFLLRPAEVSLNVGLFPDARLARGRVRALARGGNVLNLFAYTGGFTVAALAGGAVGVDQVDASARMAGWAARNVAVNGYSPRACRFIVDDALHVTTRLARQGRRYALVVADPPTFGRSERGAHNNQELEQLLSASLAVTESGGRLMFSNNTRGLDALSLWNMVVRAATGAGVHAVLEETIHAGADFPRLPARPELDRFKMVVVRVER